MQHLDNAWPHKGCCQPQHFTWNKRSQSNGRGWKITPFVFDINNKPKHWSHILQPFHLLTKLCYSQRIFDVPKKPTITWKGSHWSFKKWIIMINVSILTINIHRSKDVVQELQDSRDEEMYISLVFSTILGKISLAKIHLNQKLRDFFVSWPTSMELQQKIMAPRLWILIMPNPFQKKFG